MRGWDHGLVDHGGNFVFSQTQWEVGAKFQRGEGQNPVSEFVSYHDYPSHRVGDRLDRSETRERKWKWREADRREEICGENGWSEKWARESRVG